jgi:hypothetical protein
MTRCDPSSVSRGGFQHFAIEEEERSAGLRLGGGGYLPLHGEPGEEVVHLDHAKFARMPHSMMADVPPNPVDVGLLRPRAEVPGPYGFRELAEELGTIGGVPMQRIRHPESLGSAAGPGHARAGQLPKGPDAEGK